MVTQLRPYHSQFFFASLPNVLLYYYRGATKKSTILAYLLHAFMHACTVAVLA
jgi:hypothetical protein